MEAGTFISKAVLHDDDVALWKDDREGRVISFKRMVEMKRQGYQSPKDLLKQYRSLGKEIELLEHQLLTQRSEADTVVGSMKAYPYISRVITIHGISERTTDRLERRKCRLIAERERIEEYIDNITDSFIRGIISMRYIEGYEWSQVAQNFGGNNTPDSVRKAAERYFLRE